MAHHTLRASYQKLTDRLNLCPQGAPPSELLYHILSLLFSKEEAELVPAPKALPNNPVSMTMRDTDVNVILRALARIADLLINKADEIVAATSRRLRDGVSYPAARAEVIARIRGALDELEAQLEEAERQRDS